MVHLLFADSHAVQENRLADTMQAKNGGPKTPASLAVAITVL